MARTDRESERRTRIVPPISTAPYGMGAPMETAPPVVTQGASADPASPALQELLDVTIDSSKCFDEAAELVGEQPLAEVFQSIAKQRRSQAEELARYLGDRGEHPDAAGTITSSLHRAWVKLKAALTEDDAPMILEEAERVEDHVEEKYEQVKLTEMPDDVQEMLTRHQQAIRASHADVRRLWDEHRERADE